MRKKIQKNALKGVIISRFLVHGCEAKMTSHSQAFFILFSINLSIKNNVHFSVRQYFPHQWSNTC